MCLCVVCYLNTCSKIVENTVRGWRSVEKGPGNEDGYWTYSLSAVLCLSKVEYVVLQCRLTMLVFFLFIN